VSDTTVAAFGLRGGSGHRGGIRDAAEKDARLRGAIPDRAKRGEGARVLAGCEYYVVCASGNRRAVWSGAEVFRGKLGHGEGIFCGWVSADDVVDATNSRLGEHAGAAASDSPGLRQALKQTLKRRKRTQRTRLGEIPQVQVTAPGARAPAQRSTQRNSGIKPLLHNRLGMGGADFGQGGGIGGGHGTLL